MEKVVSLFGMKENFVGKGQSLDELIIKNKTATFFFEMDDFTMEPGILEGDILCVDRSYPPLSDSVVVVAHEGALLCRRLVIVEGVPSFVSDNDKCEDLTCVQDKIIWGVVTHVIRKL